MSATRIVTHRGPTSSKRHGPRTRISANHPRTLIHEEPLKCGYVDIVFIDANALAYDPNTPFERPLGSRRSAVVVGNKKWFSKRRWPRCSNSVRRVKQRASCRDIALSPGRK